MTAFSLLRRYFGFSVAGRRATQQKLYKTELDQAQIKVLLRMNEKVKFDGQCYLPVYTVTLCVSPLNV